MLGTQAVHAEDFEAISSKVAKDYVRKKLPDGTFQPESYVFGQGDNWGGARVDPTLDPMTFMDIARVVAVPLADKRYLPTANPATTRLLIMISWGTTRAPEHATETISHTLMQDASRRQQTGLLALRDAKQSSQRPGNSAEQLAAKMEIVAADNDLLIATIGVQAEDQRREDLDMRTATMLGYDSWWVKTAGAMGGTALGGRKQDMLNELEEDRYFVVLMAFDYQMMVKQKKNKFLWETRFSIREHNHAFDKQISTMVKEASAYFGTNSNGLQHLELPEAHVELGLIKSLGVVSGAGTSPAATPGK